MATTAHAPSVADRAESAFTWGVFLYSLARIIPVWGALKRGSVNPWVFLAIDLATAWPYAKSWPRLARSLWQRSYQRAAGWAIVLIGSFLAPYLYVAWAGENVAPWVWWVLGLFIAIGILSAVFRLRATFAERNPSA